MPDKNFIILNTPQLCCMGAPPQFDKYQSELVRSDVVPWIPQHNFDLAGGD